MKRIFNKIYLLKMKAKKKNQFKNKIIKSKMKSTIKMLLERALLIQKDRDWMKLDKKHKKKLKTLNLLNSLKKMFLFKMIKMKKKWLKLLLKM